MVFRHTPQHRLNRRGDGNGLLWRASQGGVHAASGHLDNVELGGRARLLQLSSELCTPRRATGRVLEGPSGHDIRRIEIDIADRPDLAAQLNVLQSPTTLILDAHGAVLSRIGCGVRRDIVAAELDRVLALP